MPAQKGPRHISNRELRMEKHGRVVDADTGAGISDVKLIVSWRTSSTGLSGLYGGGTWCDLQKIVTTNAAGNYTIPDVSSELDISDRGTHGGFTPMGWLSTKHDADWIMIAFKPGYVRLDDMKIFRRVQANWSEIYFDWPTTPDVAISIGKFSVQPIAMRKSDLELTDNWQYDAWVLSGTKCSDRMAHNISRPELSEIAEEMISIVRPIPCTLPAPQVLSPAAFGAFARLSHPGPFDLKFLETIKALNGDKNPSRFDPTERINATAGTVCRALNAEKK